MHDESRFIMHLQAAAAFRKSCVNTLAGETAPQHVDVVERLFESPLSGAPFR
jgi:hypothetical protein